jgi:hypothetical protein
MYCPNPVYQQLKRSGFRNRGHFVRREDNDFGYTDLDLLAPYRLQHETNSEDDTPQLKKLASNWFC